MIADHRIGFSSSISFHWKSLSFPANMDSASRIRLLAGSGYSFEKLSQYEGSCHQLAGRVSVKVAVTVSDSFWSGFPSSHSPRLAKTRSIDIFRGSECRLRRSFQWRIQELAR